jgi:hypothetical protein
MFSMKRIDQIEKHLPDKCKALLHCLRAHDWQVVGVDDEESDWALAERWLIESTRENRGAALSLWFFRYDGLHDGMDRVVAAPCEAQQPSAYGGTPSIEFDRRGFEKRLEVFMASLHWYRVHGTFVIRDGDDDRRT